MVTIASLWLSLLLATVLVWIASALVWMVLPHHKSDYKSLPDEDGVRNALNPGLSPGQYMIPHMTEWDPSKDPEGARKFTEGPVGFLTVVPRGVPNMSKMVLRSLVFYLFVAGTVAYLATRSIPAGADYLAVFRFTGTVAWAAYGFAIIPDAIWFGRPWKTVWKHLADAFLYALLTAGAFAGFWPG